MDIFMFPKFEVWFSEACVHTLTCYYENKFVDMPMSMDP